MLLKNWRIAASSEEVGYVIFYYVINWKSYNITFIKSNSILQTVIALKMSSVVGDTFKGTLKWSSMRTRFFQTSQFLRVNLLRSNFYLN